MKIKEATIVMIKEMGTCTRGRGEAPQSILSSASCRGLGVGFGPLWRLGSGCSAFAVVSFALFAGSRPVLVLVAPRGGDFVRP